MDETIIVIRENWAMKTNKKCVSEKERELEQPSQSQKIEQNLNHLTEKQIYEKM